MSFSVTRVEALKKLDDFIEKNLLEYTKLRNFDFGIQNRKNTSCLSPYVTHGVINEVEIINKVLKKQMEDLVNIVLPSLAKLGESNSEMPVGMLLASLVAETHRILSRGGIFIYPGDSRKGYEKGRLRMVYECAPIAFIIAQAGGGATDIYNNILSVEVEDLHGRTPFVFGSINEVNRVQVYHDLPGSEVSPLFGKRGLFSAHGGVE